MSEQPKKHTPGPWRWGVWKMVRLADYNAYEFRPAVEAGTHEELILSCTEYGDQATTWRGGGRTVLCALDDRDATTVCVDESDMALIAAAPDLLAALENLYEVEISVPGVLAMKEKERWEQAIGNARTAIAKAKLR